MFLKKLEHVFMMVYSHWEYAGMIRDYMILEFHTSRVRTKLFVIDDRS